MRTKLVWRKANMLPTVMVSAESPQINGCHTSRPSGNAVSTNTTSATNPAALLATDKNAVTGVGAPS